MTGDRGLAGPHGTGRPWGHRAPSPGLDKGERYAATEMLREARTGPHTHERGRASDGPSLVMRAGIRNAGAHGSPRPLQCIAKLHSTPDAGVATPMTGGGDR